jgi:GH25 family lysozyme M1 (1,4-beta-N-acetylmuramidase)
MKRGKVLQLSLVLAALLATGPVVGISPSTAFAADDEASVTETTANENDGNASSDEATSVEDESSAAPETTETEATDDAAQTEDDVDEYGLTEDQRTYAGVSAESAASSSGVRRVRRLMKSTSSATTRSSDYTQLSGIDVSFYQNTIDWASVKDAGNDFAMIKLAGRGWGTSGKLYTDPMGKKNLVNAKKAGLQVGVYFFSQAITTDEAVVEADYICDLLDSYGVELDLPVIIDYEYESNYRLNNGASKEYRTKVIRAFCEEVEARGYTPGIYANSSMLANTIDGVSLARDYFTWVACYGVSAINYYTGVYDMWQYSQYGTVDGIESTSVDMDYWYKGDVEPGGSADTDDSGSTDTYSPITGTQSIADGMYTLHSEEDLSYCLDISCASMDDSANAQLYSSNDTAAQKFQVTYLGDGYYSITSVNSDKALDVSCASTAAGANVQQYESNGTKAQKWVIKSTDDGYYQILSSYTGYALTASSKSGISDGTNVTVDTNNGLSTQKFRLSPVADDATIGDGTYVVQSALSSSYAMDSDSASKSNYGNLQIYTKNGTKAQSFHFEYKGYGTYEITNVNSGLAIDLSAAGLDDGTNVQQYEQNDTLAQRWYVIANTDGTYTLYSALSGAAIDVYHGVADNCQNVQVYSPNGTAAQKWTLNSDVSGTYTIVCAGNTGYCLDIDCASTEDGANLQIYQSNGTKAQIFKIVALSSGYCYIQNVGSGKVIDVRHAGTDDYTNIWQYTYNGSDAQLWKILANGDGTYTFINKGSGKALDISCNQYANCTNVQLYTSNGTYAQRFILKDIS